MYEQMQDAIRKATKVELDGYFNPATREYIYEITRNGELLNRSVYDDLVVIQSPAGYVAEQQIRKVENWVDVIIASVDWDNFYPVGWMIAADGTERPIPRVIDPYEFSGFQTIVDLPTGDNRR